MLKGDTVVSLRSRFATTHFSVYGTRTLNSNSSKTVGTLAKNDQFFLYRHNSRHLPSDSLTLNDRSIFRQ